ncbi:hypothetical protein VVS316_03042 [Vibrio vulnificus]|nr:hypothetical protein VVS316_03042 [Vibrio vulnificus]
MSKLVVYLSAIVVACLVVLFFTIYSVRLLQGETS